MVGQLMSSPLEQGLDSARRTVAADARLRQIRSGDRKRHVRERRAGRPHVPRHRLDAAPAVLPIDRRPIPVERLEPRRRLPQHSLDPRDIPRDGLAHVRRVLEGRLDPRGRTPRQQVRRGHLQHPAHVGAERPTPLGQTNRALPEGIPALDAWRHVLRLPRASPSRSTDALAARARRPTLPPVDPAGQDGSPRRVRASTSGRSHRPVTMADSARR